MGLNVTKEVGILNRMTVPELQRRYAEVFGEATRAHHKGFLCKRITWRLQALAEGDLSERARRRALELANDADLRLSPPKAPASPVVSGAAATEARSVPQDGRLPMPGTVITRDYKGQTIRVTVLDTGLEYDGQVYNSLSAVAQAVTGCHWNGYHFFGLRNGKDAK